MLDECLLWVATGLTADGYAAYWAAFLWGLVSILFSPCSLASIPLIIGYVGGYEEEGKTRRAFWFSAVFSSGIFLAITAVGLVTAALGRVMGDIGGGWKWLLVAILVLVALALFDRLPLGFLSRLQPKPGRKGLLGALGLGLGYGAVSGPCLFGFMMPILALIAVQASFWRGLVLTVIFALAHCLPIIIGGTSVALVKRLLAANALGVTALVFRRGAGVVFLFVAAVVAVKS
ncbi:MAG TPA: cytochrome c biogenesis protein CcdA [bacterium]|nr:cytochrome c biogenesis protein CcdA [bacterium]